MRKPIVILLVLVTALALVLTGCKGKKDKKEEEPQKPDYSAELEGVKAGTLLIDYFEQPAAVPGDTSYSELVLYARDAVSLSLVSYVRASEDTPEKETRYVVPVSIYSDVMAAIDKADMGSWNDNSEYGGITGYTYVTKFYRGGEYTRVSSEHMPDDGKEAFWTVWSILSAQAKEENLDE